MPINVALDSYNHAKQTINFQMYSVWTHHFQFIVDVSKSYSVAWLSFPAVPHELADDGRAVFGRNEHDSLQDKLNGFVVGVAVIRLFAVAVDFPQNDAVRPNVRFEGKSAVHYAFWGHPAHGQQSRASNLVQKYVYVNFKRL